MEEFERAIALNPRNGSAHLNIAKTYYLISEPGDYRYELALDAFAAAIVADPLTYGPMVIASLREIGYTWKEDLEGRLGEDYTEGGEQATLRRRRQRVGRATTKHKCAQQGHISNGALRPHDRSNSETWCQPDRLPDLAARLKPKPLACQRLLTPTLPLYRKYELLAE